jgi:opacity protein-like surface antigen
MISRASGSTPDQIEGETMISRSLAAMAALGAVAASPAAGADLYRPSLKDAPVADAPTYKYYLGVRGGWTFPQDTDFDVLGLNVKNDYDTGYFVSGVVGMELARMPTGRLRGDIEVGYSSADVSAHTITGLGKFSGDQAFGRTATTFGMASLYYDFETGTVFKPFIGAGGGIADVDFKNHGVTPTGTVLNSSDTAYAYHLTAGANVALSASLDLEVAYRFFGTTGAELKAIDGTVKSVDTQDHQILLGLRQTF